MEAQHIIKIERILVNGKEVYVSQSSLVQQENSLLFLFGFIFLILVLGYLYYRKSGIKSKKSKKVAKKRAHRRKRKV